MLGLITWLPGLKRLNVLKADDIVIVLLFTIRKMSEVNFNVNLLSSESDDDMSSTGITEKELVAIENKVIPIVLYYYAIYSCYVTMCNCCKCPLLNYLIHSQNL